MDLDALLAQALALASEDRRGQLADVIEQIVNEAREDWAETAYENGYSKALEDDFVMGDTLSLDIRAEQLTTAYELAKDEGLYGDELNAVVVRHLEAVRRAALEEAVRWSCLGCETGTPLEDDPVLGFIHRRAQSRPTQCEAAAIHRMLQGDQVDDAPLARPNEAP